MSEPLAANVLHRLDPIAAQLAADVLGAVLDGYDATPELAGPCAAGLVAGGGIAADHCCAAETADGEPCEGQLTVRVADVYPTETFPQPRQSAIPADGVSPWAVALEVSVLRCAPAMAADGSPPSMAEQMGAAERALADAGLLRHVLTAFAINADTAHTFGQLTPLGPDGGCVGSAVTVTFLME